MVFICLYKVLLNRVADGYGKQMHAIQRDMQEMKETCSLLRKEIEKTIK